jgi:hypothetical protein
MVRIYDKAKRQIAKWQKIIAKWQKIGLVSLVVEAN